MRILTPAVQKAPSSRQLSAAAESVAAAQFATYGLDVRAHGPRARYFYDLSVANSAATMKVSVYGTFRGFWNLVDPFTGNPVRNLIPADYHRAIDRWLDRQATQAVFCLVQFDSADLKTTPRLYLATPAEIATRLHAGVDQLGDTALYEQYEVEDSNGRHGVQTLPAQWRFSQSRVAELMAKQASPALELQFSDAAAYAAAHAAARIHSLPTMN